MYCIYDLLKKHMSTASNVIKYAIFNQWNTLKIKDKCKSDVTLHNFLVIHSEYVNFYGK